MPKEKSDSSIITVEQKLLISKLNFYTSEIQCTKCNEADVFRYIGNTNQKPTKPIIECKKCQNKPYISFFEREFKNLDHSHPYVPETPSASNSKKITKKSTPTIVKKQIADIENVINTTTSTPINNNNNINNNISISPEEWKLMLDKINLLETKTASMERTIVILKKVIQVHKLEVEEDYLNNEIFEEDGLDVEMNEINESQNNFNITPKKSMSTPIFSLGSQASKWAKAPTTSTNNNNNINNNNNNNNNNNINNINNSNNKNNSNINNNNINKKNKNNKNNNKIQNTKKTKTSNNKTTFTYADITKQQKKVDNTIKKINIAARAYFVPIDEHKGHTKWSSTRYSLSIWQCNRSFST
ncbi:hypothetical protein BD770DRAFT_412584 [Pilaira anomala]|nr:hypothetical protein BD770DRAFT_412584 [Pilaira anomala]